VIGTPAVASGDTVPKVLYLPNEGDFQEVSGQVGGRAAFNEMEQDGTFIAFWQITEWTERKLVHIKT